VAAGAPELSLLLCYSQVGLIVMRIVDLLGIQDNQKGAQFIEEEKKRIRDKVQDMRGAAPVQQQVPGAPDGQQETIAVDFDGTLAHYTGFKGSAVLGKPVPGMVARVQQALQAGKRVVVFTARVHGDDGTIAKLIQAWCKQYIGQELPVTNVKDPSITEIWDDRAKSVVKNKGLFAGKKKNPRCPKCGGKPGGLLPPDFEFAHCQKCGKLIEIGADGTVNWMSPNEPAGADYQHGWTGIDPITHQHAPGIKNPIKTKVPMAQDGWKKGSSKAARKKAEEDMARVKERLERQVGRPAVAQTAAYPIFPSMWTTM
jgi:hypothetical protein